MPVLSFALSFASDKPAYEAGPGKHGHVVKPHAALFERVARSAVDLARQSPMLLCILCFWRPTIIYPFFIKINFIL